MPKTLLVVDDSATMRKVFELTFGGEDLTVVTHDGGSSVVARAKEARPAAAVVDVNLGGSTGYDVCKALKAESSLGGMPVLLLYSEQSPLDDGKARECGADGSFSKPFDTQVAIDRIRQVLSGGAPVAAAPTSAGTPGVPNRATNLGATMIGSPTAAPAGAPAAKLPSSAGVGSMGSAGSAATRPKATQMFGPGALPFIPSPGGTAPAPSGAGAPTGPSAPVPAPKGPSAPTASAGPASRDSAEIELTVDGEDELSLSPGPMPSPAATPAPAPKAPVPGPAIASALGGGKPASPGLGPASKPGLVPSPAAAKPAAPVPAPAPVHHAAPGPAAAPVAPAAATLPAVTQLSQEVQQRVGAMGLTPAQVEAVTALTREVVERVVWEVVPQLAETLIREELRRLTAE